MRLKTKLVMAITGLVFILVSILSSLYVVQLLHDHIQQSFAATDILARQLNLATANALKDGISRHPVNARDPNAVRNAIVATLHEDPSLTTLLNSAIRYSPTIFDITVADKDGVGLLSSDPEQENAPIPVRPPYSSLVNGSPLQVASAVFGQPRVYNVSLDLKSNNQPFITINVGIRTTFLRAAFQPWLFESFIFISLAIGTSLIVAAFVGNLALRPIEQISARLDALQAEAEVAGELESGKSSDAVVQVSNKIERLGRRMRNVEEVFSALKENLDQVMSNLEDGIMLFTRDARAVLVSDSVERFLGMNRDLILGAEVQEIFDRSTLLGRTVRDAFDSGESLVQEEITTETGRRVQVSIDFIHDERSIPDHRQTLGALLTLHDVESVREIESELELSRRMAAIGRLTSGVGHEVKNPINAIVVHLELLRNKLDGTDSRALRHLEIISSEIQRLDRVVQTLVDFSKPVELQLQDQDLRAVVSSVLSLASAELETRDVRVVSRMPERAMVAKIDADLMKQAILNVVLNGAQAMASGGQLTVSLGEENRSAVISVRDEGEGIPADILHKIFDLYFTTRKDGSGIGLAMTYRIMQLHHGQIDVESEPGKGTTFQLRVPLINITDNRLRGFSENRPALAREHKA
jgi:PAS domain S-box-containing protein